MSINVGMKVTSLFVPMQVYNPADFRVIDWSTKDWLLIITPADAL